MILSHVILKSLFVKILRTLLLSLTTAIPILPILFLLSNQSAMLIFLSRSLLIDLTLSIFISSLISWVIDMKDINYKGDVDTIDNEFSDNDNDDVAQIALNLPLIRKDLYAENCR